MPMHFIKYFVAMKNMKPMNTKKGVGAKKKKKLQKTRVAIMKQKTGTS